MMNKVDLQREMAQTMPHTLSDTLERAIEVLKKSVPYVS